MTQMPAPSAALMPSTLTPKARAPAGISSAATTAMSTASAVAKPRAGTWIAVYQARDGATAVSGASTQPPAADTRTRRRRPARSASATSATAKNTERRANVRATVCGR